MNESHKQVLKPISFGLIKMSVVLPDNVISAKILVRVVLPFLSLLNNS